MVQSLGNSWTKSQLHANLSAPVESSENFHFGLNVAPIRSNYIGSEYNPFPSTHVRAQPALFGAGATLQHPSQIPNTLSTSTAGYLPASEYGGHSGGFSAHNPAPQQNYYGEQPVVPPRASRPVTSEPSLHDYHPPPSSLALQFSELPDRVPQFSDISHFSSAPSVQAPGPVNHTVPSVSHYGTTPLGASVLNSGWESEHYRATERTERSRAPAVGQQTLSGALNDDDGASQQQPPPAVYGGLQPQPKTYHRPSR
ncbi:hypothetical protein M433DRAFT_549069 [Acidomyces richmondensis BFW]|nr:hypothetical protein M433DRAFT_549069 [Acidomyces richmondensis BFW]